MRQEDAVSRSGRQRVFWIPASSRPRDFDYRYPGPVREQFPINLGLNLASRSALTFRFRLTTLLALVLPFAVGSLWLNRWLDSRPIRWTEYSDEAFAKRSEDGVPTIVFFGAEWDTNSMIVKQLSFEDRDLKKLLRAKAARMLYADLTSPTPELRAAFQKVGLGPFSTPTVAIYYADAPDCPVMLDGIPSGADIAEALKRPSRIQCCDD